MGALRSRTIWGASRCRAPFLTDSQPTRLRRVENRHGCEGTGRKGEVVLHLGRRFAWRYLVCDLGDVNNGVGRLQKRIVTDYAETVGLDPQVHYAGGARLRPLPPLDTATNRVMIVGAYPSARFEVMGGLRDVPVGDNLGPFEPERYFDGSSVRTQRSADELAQFYVEPLGLDRKKDCWVTDLVKVFLFKPGHRAKYEKLGIAVPQGYERERFEELGRSSIGMLFDEILLAQPRVVITLGAEVAGILRDVDGAKARSNLLGGSPAEVEVKGRVMTMVHLAHPGIVMRKNSPSNPWPDRHKQEHIPALKAALDRILSR